MTRSRSDFLHTFYRCLLGWGVAGLLPALLISGKQGISGFALGFCSIALILGLWDLTLTHTLSGRKTNAVWESLLVFFRYALLGGLFYAIISWFAVSWPWYFTGVAMIVPGLLTATFVYKEEEGAQGAQD